MKTIDVRSSSQEMVLHGSYVSNSQPSSFLLDNAIVPSIRVLPHPSAASRFTHLVVIFLATPHSSSSAGSFDVHRVSSNFDLVYAGERPCSASSAGSQLRSFDILPPIQKDGFDSGWRLWVTWDFKGAISCESVLMDDLFQFQTNVEPTQSSSLLHDWHKVSHSTEVEQYDAAYFDNLLSLDPPHPTQPYENTDIAATFVTHLFRPGRFSSLTLQTALEEYSRQLPKRHLIPQVSAAYPSLSKKFTAVVGCQLEMETSPQTGAPVVDAFRRALKLDWMGIWARVRDLDKQARWPVSSAALDDQLLIQTREGVTMLIPEDAIGLVHRLGKSSESVEDFIDLPEGSLKRMYRALAPPMARNNAVALSAAGESISLALTRQEAEDGGSGVDLLTEQVNLSLAAAASQPVETLAGSLWDDLSECPDILRGLNESLDLLADLAFRMPSNNASELTYSGLTNSLITSTLLIIISNRYTVARHLLLISLFHLAESADEEAEELIETLSRAMVTYHRYRILRWVSEQTGEEAQARIKARRTNKRKLKGGDEMLAEGLGDLQVREGAEEGMDADGYDPGYSLLHSIIAQRVPQEVIENFAAPILEAATAFLTKTGLVSKDQVEIAPREADVKLAYTILIDGHAALAGQMSAFYPLSSGMAFVRGRAYLEVGDVDSAVRNLQQAASGCNGRSVSNKRSIPSTQQNVP